MRSENWGHRRKLLVERLDKLPEGLTSTQVATRLGISQKAVPNLLRRHGWVGRKGAHGAMWSWYRS